MEKPRIKKFTEFILESSDDKFIRFYILVKEPLLGNDKILAQLIAKARNTLFEQVRVDKSNYKKVKIDPNVPVLNFTEDNDIVESMLKEKIFSRDVLYNSPDQSEIVSDKVLFHKKFEDCPHTPLTVFNSQDALKLKFPIIAKPSKGRSGEGIRKFETPGDLQSSDEKFDLFSEMIDIKSEYRCFCFRDKIIVLNQRVNLDDNFLDDSSKKTDFYYKKISNYPNQEKLQELLQHVRDRVDLDFYSVDFAEDPSGDLHLIEVNSRTGMGPDKASSLYLLIYEDFYKKSPNKFTRDVIKKMVDEWNDNYEKEKLNECTVVAGTIGDKLFLFKNRDRSYTPHTQIMRERLNNVEIVYYTDETGWIEGMNEHGVGFIFSQLTEKDWKGYAPSYTVSDDPKDSTKFRKFAPDIKKMLTSKDADEALNFLKKSGKSGSFIVSDTSKTYEVEVYKGEMKIEKLSFSDESYYVKTNHGILIPDAGHQPSGDSIKRAGSAIRMHQAKVQLMGVKRIEDVASRMKFQAFDTKSPLNTFRTDDEELTISQCMMNLTDRVFLFYHDEHTANSIEVVDNVKDPKIEIKVLVA